RRTRAVCAPSAQGLTSSRRVKRRARRCLALLRFELRIDSEAGLPCRCGELPTSERRQAASKSPCLSARAFVWSSGGAGSCIDEAKDSHDNSLRPYERLRTLAVPPEVPQLGAPDRPRGYQAMNSRSRRLDTRLEFSKGHSPLFY